MLRSLLALLEKGREFFVDEINATNNGEQRGGRAEGESETKFKGMVDKIRGLHGGTTGSEEYEVEYTEALKPGLFVLCVCL